MSASYVSCALPRLVSALTSLGFSLAALRTDVRTTLVAARYTVARSLALVVGAAVPLFGERSDWLYAVAVIMIPVQALDAVVGAAHRDTMKTVGPLFLAVANLTALVWVIRG